MLMFYLLFSLDNLFKTNLYSSETGEEIIGNQFKGNNINTIKAVRFLIKGSDFDEQGNYFIKFAYINFFPSEKFMFPIISTYFFATAHIDTSKEYPGTVRIHGWDLANMWISIHGNIKKANANITILLFGSN